MANKAVKNKSNGPENAKNTKMTKAATAPKGRMNQPKGSPDSVKPTKMAKKQGRNATEGMMF